MSKYIVAISGGVDSAVAASLLLDAGHDVQGLFMANWEDDADGYCTTAADFQDARRNCVELGIPLHRVSFAAEYRERVFKHFLAELRAGRTPNPDVVCNREIKFGVCLAYARRLGAERFATGHYARIAKDGRLLRGVDTAKDQSYFLHVLAAAELAECDFPLGSLCKPEVRAIARERGLPAYDRPDSTGICFIGERPFGEFLESWLPGIPGPIETAHGEVIGEHHGLARYTLGQRSGLRVGGLRDRAAAPWYVAGKDLVRNSLVVVQGRDHPALHCAGLRATRLHWVSGQAPARAFACTAKLRYRQPDLRCAVGLTADGADVRFPDPQAGAVPGQYAVFYRDEECLGGGVIDSLIIDAEETCRTASRHGASSPSVTAASTTSASTR